MKQHTRRALAVLVSLGMTAGLAAPAFAAQPVNADKDETVYIILNSDGSIQSQTVTEWLHADGSLQNVADRTTLDNIQNLKGTLAPRIDGGVTYWDTDASDLWYQGSTTATPPVTAAITYTLDGKEMTAEEMAGKSGHVVITVKLTNNDPHTCTVQGKQRTIYTPFATVAAIDLPSDRFTGVKAEHGTVQTDSTNQLACFLAMPGMRESFGKTLSGKLQELEDLMLDTLVVEADTTDFEAPSILMASATSMEELEKQADLPALDDKMDQLNSGSTQLKDGASQLAEATAALQDKMNQMASSYAAFDAGVASALEGAQQLHQGTGELNGAVSTLQSGAGSLASGSAQLKDGANRLNDTLSGQLVPGLSQSAGLQQQLEQDMAALLEKLNGMLESPALPEEAVQQVSQAVAAQFTAVGNAVANASAGAAAQTAAGVAANAAVTTVSDSAAAAVMGLVQNGTLTPDQAAAVSAALTQGIQGADVAGAVNAAVAAAQGDIAAAVSAAVKGDAGVQQAKEQAGPTILAAINAAIPQVTQSMLQSVQGDLDKVIGEASALMQGMQQLTGALYNPENPADTNTVAGAVAGLASGASQLDSGVSALAGGANQLKDGVNRLDGGASALADGLRTLAGSSKTVQDALGQFQSGAGQLNSGMQTLRSGVGEYVDQVQKAVSQLDPESLSEAAAVADALREQANAYTGYAGSPDGVRNATKFVMKTAAPVKQQAEEAPAAPEKEQKSFWQRLRDLF